MVEPFIGQVNIVGYNFAPRNWALCNGSLIAINENQALFALIGVSFGGDGRSTFGLPDLRGKTAIGQGRHPGGVTDWGVGQQAGAESVTIVGNNLPAHTHPATFSPEGLSANATVNVNSGTGSQDTAVDGYLATGMTGTGRTAEKITNSYANMVTSASTLAADAVSVNITGSGSVTVGNNNSSNLPLMNMQPSLSLNYVIAIQGVFPSRS